MNKELTDYEKCDLLIRFIKTCSDGIKKPHDPTYILQKLNSLEESGVNVDGVRECCAETSEVRDSKDLKVFIIQCANEFCNILGVKVENSYNNRY